MYSKEDLESRKKDELRTIVVKLGLKGRRLKAELIDLILKHQSEVNPSASPQPAPDSESDHEDLVASAALDVASAIKADGASKKALEKDCAAASDFENSNTSILDVDNMLSEDHLDSNLNVSKKLSSSGPEDILKKAAKKETQSSAEPSRRPRMKRSNTFQLDSPAITINPGAPPPSPPAAKGRAKRLRSVSPQPEEPSLLAVKRTRKSRMMATVAATLPRRGRRGTIIPHTDSEPRRHSRGSSPRAPAVQRLPSVKTTPELFAAKGRPQLRSNSSRVLQRTPPTKSNVSEEISTKRAILTPKSTLKTLSTASSASKTKLPILKQSTPVLAVAETLKQPEVSSPVVNSPAPVTSNVPQTSVLEKSLLSIPAPEADIAVDVPVSAKRLSRAASLTKPTCVLPSGESLSAVASPRLFAVTALGRRLSSAKRLSSSASPLIKRVVPTLAQPVFTIGKHDKKEQDKDGSQSCGKAKSSIPRFIAYAQKINKMPNFKRIHAKAFNNMQNLDEFVSKKKQLSSSVQKAPRPSASFVPSVVSTKDMKLTFSDKSTVVKFGAGPSTTDSPKTPRFGAAHAKRAATAAATPRQSRVPLVLDSVYAARNTTPSAAFAVSLKENIRPGSPRVSLATPSHGASRIAVIKTMPSGARIKGVGYQPSPNCAVPLNNQHGAAFKGRAEMHGSVEANKGNVSVEVSAAADAADSRPASKLPQYKPYRGPLRSPGTNRAALKQLASKRPAIATKEERRDRNKEYIKGVRTNKRFQLQMERRGVMP